MYENNNKLFYKYYRFFLTIVQLYMHFVYKLLLINLKRGNSKIIECL